MNSEISETVMCQKKARVEATFRRSCDFGKERGLAPLMSFAREILMPALESGTPELQFRKSGPEVLSVVAVR